jgi:hypothetical protein
MGGGTTDSFEERREERIVGESGGEGGVCTVWKDEGAGRGRRIRGIEEGMRWAGICMDVLVSISHLREG